MSLRASDEGQGKGVRLGTARSKGVRGLGKRGGRG